MVCLDSVFISHNPLNYFHTIYMQRRLPTWYRKLAWCMQYAIKVIPTPMIYINFYLDRIKARLPQALSHLKKRSYRYTIQFNKERFHSMHKYFDHIKSQACIPLFKCKRFQMSLLYHYMHYRTAIFLINKRTVAGTFYRGIGT